MASNRVDPNNTKKSKLNDNIDEDESGEQDDSEIIDMIDMNFSDLNSNYNRPNNDNVSERQNTVRDQTNTQHDQTFETPTPKKTTVYTLASENLFRKFITQKEKTSIYQVLFDDDRLISKYNRPNSVILADKNKNFLQRNKEFMINKTQKLLRKSRERELQEKQTLRDKPAVITTMEDRKFEEQFKDKLKHLRMKENNIKLRRQKDMEEMKKKCTFKPQIDNGSKIIVGQIIERNNSKARQGQGTKYEDVYNRLFNGKNGNRSEILLNDRNYSTTKNRNTIGSKSEERKNPIAMDFTTYLNLKQKPSSPNHYEYIKPRVFDYQYYLQNRGNKNPSKNSRGNLSTRNVKNQRKLESPSKNITSTSPMSKYRIETDIEQGNLKLANKKSNVIVLQKFLNEFELGLPGHDVTITEFNDLMYKLGFTIYDQNKHFDTTTRNIKTEKQMLSKAYEYINKLKIDTCSINETFLMFCLIVQGFYFSIDYLIAHRNSKLPNKSESNDVNLEVVKSQWENRKHEESDDEEDDKKCDNNEEPIKETNESEDSKNQTEDFEFAKKKYSSDFYALETYLNYLKRHILKVNCKCFNPKLALEIKLTFRQFNSNRKRHLEIIFKEKRDIKVKNIDMTYSTSQVNFNSRFSNSRIDKSNELYQQLSNNNQSSNYATRSRINLISHNKYSSSAKKERNIKLMKQRMEEEEMKECTFRPSLSHKSLQLTGKLFRNNLTRLKELGGLSSTSKIDDTINFSGLSTSKIVYTDKNYMKSKATVSSNRSREEIEFERQKSHCTFKPKIIKLKAEIYNNPLNNDFLVKKSTARMILAREERRLIEAQKKIGTNSKVKARDFLNREESKEKSSWNHSIEKPQATRQKDLSSFGSGISSIKSIASKHNTKVNRTIDLDKRGQKPLFVVNLEIREGVNEKVDFYKYHDIETVAYDICLKYNLKSDKFLIIKKILSDNYKEAIESIYLY